MDAYEKEQLISEEIIRLNRLFKNLEENKKIILKGLIKQSAWLAVAIQELEMMLNEEGPTEEFRNGKQKFQRENSLSKILINYQKNYLAINKELMSYLPEDSSDELTEFLNKRKK